MVALAVMIMALTTAAEFFTVFEQQKPRSVRFRDFRKMSGYGARKAKMTHQMSVLSAPNPTYALTFLRNHNNSCR